MIAERAEHGTKVTSSDAMTRSRPVVVLPMAEIAGTLHPSPSRKGTATPPCSPTRWNTRSTAKAMRAMTPASSSATSSSTSGIMYGTTIPTSPIRPSATARATTPAVDSGCHVDVHATSRADVSPSIHPLT